MPTTMARAAMASTTSSSVNPARRSVILRRDPKALERVALGSGAVLPHDVHLDETEGAVAFGVERALVDAVLRAGVADEDLRPEPLAAHALLGMVADLGRREHGVHRRARREDGAALPRRPRLELQASAEELETRDDARTEHGERDRDLEEREAGQRRPGRRAGHRVASRTVTLPISGSRWIRIRFLARSRRLVTRTSPPVVAPFG